MLCVCVGDVMDVSVCIVRRGAVGARISSVIQSLMGLSTEHIFLMS